MILVTLAPHGGGTFMIEKVRQLTKKRLESRKVDAILGLRENNAHFAPYLFTETGKFEQKLEFYKKI